MRLPYSNTPWFHLFLAAGASLVVGKLWFSPPETGNMHVFVMVLAALIFVRSAVLFVTGFKKSSPDE
jgi:hypothetical protein